MHHRESEINTEPFHHATRISNRVKKSFVNAERTPERCAYESTQRGEAKRTEDGDGRTKDTGIYHRENA